MNKRESSKIMLKKSNFGFSVLIVGAGNMAAFYDNPKSDLVLTHAHAFSSSSYFNKIAFVDKDLSKAKMAAERWQSHYYDTIENAFSVEDFDVVVISTSDESHYENYLEIINTKCKVIVMEKPLSRKKEEAKKIHSLSKEAKKFTCVNYSRRFIPEYKILKQKIRSKDFGKFLGGTGYYGKGLFHNGSHLIDLLNLFFDEVSVDEAKAFSPVYDYTLNDPSINALLLVEKCPFFLQVIDSRLYEIFELQMVFERGMIEIKDLGARIIEYEVIESSEYEGYRNLKCIRSTNVDLNKALIYLVEFLTEYLETGKKENCISDVDTAYDTFLLCSAIKGE